MNAVNTVLATLERMHLQVDAIESFAGAMTEGLRAGLVDPSHLGALLSAQGDAMKATLIELDKHVATLAE